MTTGTKKSANAEALYNCYLVRIIRANRHFFKAIPRCGSEFCRLDLVEAIAEFTDLRWVTIEDPGQHYPF
ncbi:MAG: hypothetical protein E5V30_16520 [Mesorhizobium sp.]|nr:MAG: hypothetical protein E5V30_16520 [Mesorhizobium sp.]